MKIEFLQTMSPEFSFLISPKLPVNWKNDNDFTICRYDVIANFF